MNQADKSRVRRNILYGSKCSYEHIEVGGKSPMTTGSSDSNSVGSHVSRFEEENCLRYCCNCLYSSQAIWRLCQLERTRERGRIVPPATYHPIICVIFMFFILDCSVGRLFHFFSFFPIIFIIFFLLSDVSRPSVQADDLFRIVLIVPDLSPGSRWVDSDKSRVTG